MSYLKRSLLNNRLFLTLYRHTIYRSAKYREWREIRSRRLYDTPFGFRLMSPRQGINLSMQDGTFEKEEVALVQSLLEKTDVFIDVGANIGLYTCIARQKEKRTVAVEPQPRNLACLYATLSANGWPDVEIFPMGLSDTPGLVKLYGDTGPSASMLEGWAGIDSSFVQVIPVTTLDAITGKRFDKERILIKVDVEGAEHTVLQGARDIIQRTPRPVWMIEICLHEHHPGGLNPDYLRTFNLFWQQGYRAYTADQRRIPVRKNDIQQWINQGYSESGVMNYLFTAEGD